jgi:hypothetical protein
MEDSKTTKSTSDSSKTRVNIPVTVSLLVPVEIDHEIIEPEQKDKILGIPILELGDLDDGVEILEKAVEAMKESKVVEEALLHLMAGAHEFRKKYTGIVGKYTPFLGISEEESF